MAYNLNISDHPHYRVWQVDFTIQTQRKNIVQVLSYTAYAIDTLRTITSAEKQSMKIKKYNRLNC